MLSERARRGPRPRLGHRVLASFLRTVAEACSPQRLREESAREIYLTLLSLATCVRESVSNYAIVSCLQQPLSRGGPTKICRRVASIDFSLIGNLIGIAGACVSFWGHSGIVPELGEIIAEISHLTSFCP